MGRLYNGVHFGNVKKHSLGVRGVKVRRSNIEVVADILKIGEQGAGKTRIMHQANMSYHQLQKYLDLLVDRGCLKRTVIDKSHVSYGLTVKGQMLLKSINKVLGALDHYSAESRSQVKRSA